MRFFKAILALPALAIAAPSGSWSDNGGLTDADTQYIIDQSIVFLQHLDKPAAIAAARSIFADNIVEYGDSINSLRGDALGTQVEKGLESYINETIAAPSYASITTIDQFHSKDQILWEWFFDLGIPQPPNYRIQGVTILKVNSDKKVYYQDIVFNSLAWAESAGFTVTPPAGGIGGE